jgi:outer membrane protein TolC
MALTTTLALGACTTVGPDFARPQVPWLRDWSGGEWRALVDAAPPRAPVPYDEWWRTFGDPALDRLVAEAQRVNPGVRTAGMRIMEARAQLGIAGSALFPQLQQVTARHCTGNRGPMRGRSSGLRERLDSPVDRFLGKFSVSSPPTPPLRQHRAVR